MILINNQWYMIESMYDVQKIVADEFSYELAREMGKYISEHNDEEYNDLESHCSDLETEIECLNDEIDYLEEKLGEAGLL